MKCITFYKVALSLSFDTSISGNKLVIVIQLLGKTECPGATQDTLIRLLNEGGFSVKKNVKTRPDIVIIVSKT